MAQTNANGPFAPSSPSLILTQPTSSECQQLWSATHGIWGASLSHDEYLAREAYLVSVPLARDNGNTRWILTDANSPPDQRPIFSSAETLRKPAIICTPGRDGGPPALHECIAHTIGSVFTEPKHRGKGHASTMMRKLGPTLATWQGGGGGGDGWASSPSCSSPKCVFSTLYSDVGKKFYAQHGWLPYQSTHIEFPPLAKADPSSPTDRALTAKPLIYHDLPPLCALDESLLRARLLSQAADPANGYKTLAASLPTLDQMLWHLMREDFITSRIFSGRTPRVRGAVAGPPGKRVWAIWARSYSGKQTCAKPDNTLYMLRVVMEDGTGGVDDEAVRGFREIMRMAQEEAAEWKCAKGVHVWNVSGRVRELVERCGIDYVRVEREEDSIPCLMWYGDGPVGEVEWVCNEKYGWF